MMLAGARPRFVRDGLAAAVACCGVLLGAPTVSSEEPPAATDPEKPDRKIQLEWSATLIAAGKLIADREAHDDVVGFFDQYEFTPNKNAAFPIELGVRDASLDLLDEGGTPLFQLRLNSPTSNLGVSGSQVDQPFFNQRVDTWTRTDDWALDLDYRRMRTEQLRRFPNTVGGGLVFDDLTDSGARFDRDRTGFTGELRRAIQRGLADPATTAGRVAGEAAFRGGYEARGGLRQLRTHRDPVNDWLGLPQAADRGVADVGGGLLAGSRGSDTWLVTLDFDHERLRWRSPTLFEGDLGAAPPADTRTLGFVPDSNRNTGRLEARGRLLGDLTWNAGYQLSVLEQVGEGTPDQVAAGLIDNRIFTHSAAAGVVWSPAPLLTLRADADFDLRDNRIDRTTTLFAPDNGTQVDPFVDDWHRIVARFEAETRFMRRNTLTLGVRYEDTSRSIDFADPGAVRVLPENALVSDTTRFVSVYGRTRLRPWKRLQLNAELGYRAAPEVGYVTDLDNFVYGRFDARYVFATPRPIVLSAHVRGDSGRNRGFEMTEGLGPDPAGAKLTRRFDRWSLGWGVSAEASPIERLTLYGSFLCARLNQDSGVTLSTVQRYFQETVPLVFTDIGQDGFMNEQKSLILGILRDWQAGFDTGLAYSYTFARATFETGGAPQLGLISDNRRIDNRTQVIDFEAGWKPTRGLRLLAGYRLQWNRDDVDAPESVGSAAAPIDRSTHQHTFTLGVRFDGSFFERSNPS